MFNCPLLPHHVSWDQSEIVQTVWLWTGGGRSASDPVDLLCASGRRAVLHQTLPLTSAVQVEDFHAAQQCDTHQGYVSHTVGMRFCGSCRENHCRSWAAQVLESEWGSTDDKDIRGYLVQPTTWTRTAPKINQVCYGFAEPNLKKPSRMETSCLSCDLHQDCTIFLGRQVSLMAILNILSLNLWLLSQLLRLTLLRRVWLPCLCNSLSSNCRLLPYHLFTSWTQSSSLNLSLLFACLRFLIILVTLYWPLSGLPTSSWRRSPIPEAVFQVWPLLIHSKDPVSKVPMDWCPAVLHIVHPPPPNFVPCVHLVRVSSVSLSRYWMMWTPISPWGGHSLPVPKQTSVHHSLPFEPISNHQRSCLPRPFCLSFQMKMLWEIILCHLFHQNCKHPYTYKCALTLQSLHRFPMSIILTPGNGFGVLFTVNNRYHPPIFWSKSTHWFYFRCTQSFFLPWNPTLGSEFNILRMQYL